MRLAALGFALFALAACQQDPPSQGARDSSAQPLTVEGYGPMRIGMTLAEARQVSGQPMNNEALEPGVPGACSEQQYTTADGDTLWLLFEGDRLGRITATYEGGARTRTAQNVGVGSTDAEVRTAYQGLVEEPAKYDDPPAHDLIAWTTPEQSGIRFEIGADGKVRVMHAGGPAIQYMEGCA